MSRIKGKYISGTSIKDERWLDPATGRMYSSEAAQSSCHHGFAHKRDGTWVCRGYVWQSDAVPALAADWYVFDTQADGTIQACEGPGTEAWARDRAANRATLYPHAKFCVMQLLPGNTVQAKPVEAPVIWS